MNKELIGRRRVRAAVASAVTASVLVLAAAMATAPSAHGALGDRYDFAPINTAGNPSVPAYPGTKAFWAGTCDLASVAAEVGVAPVAQRHCVDYGVVNNQCRNPVFPTFPCANGATPGPVIPDPWTTAPAWRRAAVSGSGAHPDGTASVWFARSLSGPNILEPDGTADNVAVELPPGVTGDTTAVAKCTGAQFADRPADGSLCPPQSQVGVIDIAVRGEISSVIDQGLYPVYNLEPRPGYTAELGIPGVADFTSVRIVARARTSRDFGVTGYVGQIPAALPLFGQAITLWGVPWAAEHDRWRVKVGVDGSPDKGLIPRTGLAAGDQAPYQPSWGEIRPFFTNPTECDGSLLNTRALSDTYHQPGPFDTDGEPIVAGDPASANWKTADSPAPAVQGCAKAPFAPAASFAPTSTAPDSPSGLSADIDIPQNDRPPPALASDPSDSSGAPAYWKSDAGTATAQLDKTVVTLPEEMTVNPSAATGLQGCSDAQMGVTDATSDPLRFNNAEPSCPDGSKIGTVNATTPVLDGSPNVSGEVILGTPKSTDPASGQMFRLFLVLRNQARGLMAKVHGTTVADPNTGQLTATFDNNPRVPVENIEVHLKGGDRGMLAMPQTCGQRSTTSQFTPWTAAHGGGGPTRTLSDPFTVTGDCSSRFAPTLTAGMDNRAARSNGTFSFKFDRPQGHHYLHNLTAKLPKGLLASVRDVPLCSHAQAEAAACPAASRIGVVDAKAGSGDPFVLEEKGEVFLTNGYKGGEYGLAVKIRPIAGPFRGAMELSPIVVRQAIHVDRKTAQVTAVSDPFPLIHHGVPLRVREVTVLVDRGGFMLNPSDCEAKQVEATIASEQGANAGLSNPFQASGCSRLAFRPKLALRLTGRKQVKTGKHPGIRATVTQKGIPEAGIEKAEVRLPKSLALDVDNAQALCEFDQGTKPDLENHCPKGSIVGRARAVSPLLNDPLAGNVYFVKNVRRSSSGNLIRTLPMIVVALRGEIAVNLVGESNVKRGKLVNTFDQVPDAPITRFNLNIQGGKNGIIAVTRTRKALINLCAARRQIAEADIDGHNGRRHDRNVRMKTPCTKKSRKTKAQRRNAAKRKAAAKRRARAGGRTRG